MIVAIVVLLLIANTVGPLRVTRVAIELRPETLFAIGPLKVTNSLLASWLASTLLLALALRLRRRLVDVPEAHSLQNGVEAVSETLRGLLVSFAGEKTDAFFPVVLTLFLFILTCNWLGLLPGFGSIGFWQQRDGYATFVPLLRGSTSDLNTTIALAISSSAASWWFGIRYLGLKGFLGRYVAIGKFVQFFRELFTGARPRLSLLAGGVLDVFIGVLEIFEELTKILSFSFRLFGNVFGGEVLLAVMAFLMPYLASVPFLALELFTGFIQAVIFSVLSTAFFARATTQHGGRGAHADPGPGEAVAA